MQLKVKECRRGSFIESEGKQRKPNAIQVERNVESEFTFGFPFYFHFIDIQLFPIAFYGHQQAHYDSRKQREVKGNGEGNNRKLTQRTTKDKVHGHKT